MTGNRANKSCKFIKGGGLDKNVNNVLLIQFGDIGDVVYTCPCLRALRESLPKAKIIIAVQKKAEGLVNNCQWVDDVIAVDKRKRSFWQEIIYQKNFWRRVRRFKFDLAIDLRTGSRGAIMAFLSGARQRLGRYTPVGHIWRARLFTHLVFPKGQRNQYIAEYYHDTIACYGIETTNLNPEFSPPAEKIKDARLLLKRQRIPGDRPILAIQPFSLWQYKEWGITKYIELINLVTSTFKISVVITGAPNERTRAQEIVYGCRDKIFNLAGVTSIAELPALIKQTKLFLGVDSAGVHIAAAVGTPTISLYGPSPPDVWAPKGKNNIVITSNMPCIPCCNTGCQGRMESQCMEELKVETVAANVCDFLEQLPLQPRPSN